MFRLPQDDLRALGFSDSFVHPIEDKLNPLKLVKFTTQVNTKVRTLSSSLTRNN
jgi:hypothetical protein